MSHHSPASIVIATAVGLMIAAAPVALAQLPNPGMTIDPSKRYEAVFHTDRGDFTAELFAQQAPVTVNNFVFLAPAHEACPL